MGGGISVSVPDMNNIGRLALLPAPNVVLPGNRAIGFQDASPHYGHKSEEWREEEARHSFL